MAREEQERMFTASGFFWGPMDSSECISKTERKPFRFSSAQGGSYVPPLRICAMIPASFSSAAGVASASSFAISGRMNNTPSSSPTTTSAHQAAADTDISASCLFVPSRHSNWYFRSVPQSWQQLHLDPGGSIGGCPPVQFLSSNAAIVLICNDGSHVKVHGGDSRCRADWDKDRGQDHDRRDRLHRKRSGPRA